jgi:hypothetical protein
MTNTLDDSAAIEGVGVTIMLDSVLNEVGMSITLDSVMDGVGVGVGNDDRVKVILVTPLGGIGGGIGG